VTGVEVVSVQENNIRQAKLARTNPEADAIGIDFAQFPLVDELV
jgi:hypothetical protein